jgi:pimeloyl-ACP methyl ester carboxylesterase
MFKKLFFSLLRIVSAALVGFTVLLYFAQEQMLFPRKQLDEGFVLWARQQFPQSEMKIPAPDGTKLHGWFVQRKNEEKQPLLIYFGGNATEATVFLSFTEHFPQHAIAAFNYRGYGLSEGNPSQEMIFQDALYLYDLFSKNQNIDPNRIYVMGRSLGTGVATYVASQRPVNKTILISPYDSILALAEERHPFVPIQWLLKHPFKSIDYAPHIKTPALAFVGLIDEVISPEHSDRLIEKWGGKVQKITFPLANHNSIMDEVTLWRNAQAFITQ